MSRFYTTSISERMVVRKHSGRKSLSVHTRGWDLGIRIEASVNELGLDEFRIYQTTGSTGHPDGDVLIKTIVDKKSAGPRNPKGQLK